MANFEFFDNAAHLCGSGAAWRRVLWCRRSRQDQDLAVKWCILIHLRRLFGDRERAA